MNKTISSQALEVNLAQTRDVDLVIPEDHSWLLSLSENYWGIHKRIKEFIAEFHHPYSNRKEVIDLLKNITISDFWIYKKIKNQGKVIKIILEIFDNLLQEKLSDELCKQLVFIYINFFNKNLETLCQYESLAIEAIEILDKNLEDNYFSYIVNLGSFLKNFNRAASEPILKKTVFLFMGKLVRKNINFWKNSTNIEKWYKKNKSKMSLDYWEKLKPLGKDLFKAQSKHVNEAKSWEQLYSKVLTFSDMTDAFRKKIDIFKKATEQFCYIFYLLHLPGMVYHCSYLLIDLNKAIKRISHELDEEQTIQAIDELFSVFSDFKSSHINMILDYILTLGKEIINTQNEKLIHYFENKTIDFGFVSPGIVYLSNDWKLNVDRNHVKNIRVWLEIIEYDPEMMKKLLSALIIHLRIGGIFIFDTDLFQKDVTKLLNARISPIYKQIKQLCRIFPVYFSEIGAEGILRDTTTTLDETSQRNDKLIHFLRKQIHTEGNNSHINITIEIIRFWYDLNINRLKNVIPQNVLDTIDTKGLWVKGVHEVLKKICKKNNCSLDKLVEEDKQSLSKLLSKIDHENERDIKRVRLIIELYQILKEKYSFSATNITGLLKRHNFIDSRDIESFESCMKENNDLEALKYIYSFMIKLNQIIFNPAISEGWENIYHKRHIAFGIPSMYGEYHETKFEALGLTFRLERIASILVSRIISGINTNYFTARTLKDIFLVIEQLREGLHLDGIYDQGFDSKFKMFQYSLTSGSFSIKQYINIFQFMEVSIKEIINKYFIRPYHDLLGTIIPHYLKEGEGKSAAAIKKTVLAKSEIFYRELLSSAFLIQEFDNLIGEILNNLRKMVSNLSDEEIHNIMTYDPELVISPFYAETPTIDNQVFLGSKAYYLKKLYLEKYPVPPGFIITTEIFRRINSIIKLPSLNAEIDDLIKYHILELERISNLKFGDPKKPLLLSVRSGSAISMPGAMNTFLNVGLNDEITETLSKQYNFGWTSWDCYRRLLQTWGMAFGMDRNDFDQIMIDYKNKYRVSKKIDFPPEIMKDMAYAYKKLLFEKGIHFESDLFSQLKQAIISVFNSWYASRAFVYRDRMHIAEEWGTAVIVQQMVFGNLHKESGSGVLFTYDTRDNIPGINLVGDFSFLSQGEDIVAGLVNTLPISERQRLKYYQKSPFSLESEFPKIYKKLKEIANELIEIHGFGHQEIEFTFETAEPEDLYILQTREMSIIKQDKIKVFSTPEKKMIRVGCGIGIGNEVLNGVIIFDKEDMETLKKTRTHKKRVLVRPDTVPDDIAMIFECEGLLTARGGSTSHAAVTAATLGKICVVNCDNMVVDEKNKKCVINDNVFSAFDQIAIDGNNGIVYKGNYPIKLQNL